MVQSRRVVAWSSGNRMTVSGRLNAIATVFAEQKQASQSTPANQWLLNSRLIGSGTRVRVKINARYTSVRQE